MSTTIDQRVVEMRFDNKQFETNVKTSMSTLDKLKESLKLTGAAKGIENISSAVKRFDMSALGNAAQTVQAKFSALEVMAVTALANITNSAVNAGKNMISALTLDPIMAGFQEYETQINAVQTILANTSSKGTSLDQVNAALDELNTYSDKTIYNFTEMTRNIGTFTAAGVDLDTSVSAIKGIANLAAVSGSNSQQASTAMYQLSQALASGTVKLMDWNSVVNAGMGGQVFQDALKETARVHGIAIDSMIESEGSFRETLKDGWLTSEVLTETLAKFTGDLNEDQLRTMGYTEDQIQAIVKMGQTANDAATKVKTFTQLFDTLKEAAQSGWTQSWEIIVGDFEEAKALLTEVSDTFSGIIGASAAARNDVLQGWKDLGGRTEIIEALRNVFEGLLSIITPIKKAFREIFPPITAEQLYKFSKGFRELTEHLKLGDKTSDNLKITFKGLFAVLDIIRRAFSAVFNVIKPLFGGIDNLGGGVLAITGFFGGWLVKLDEIIKSTDIFNKAISGMVGFIKTAAQNVKEFVKALVAKIDFPSLEDFRAFLERVHEKMSQVGEAAGDMKSRVVDAIGSMGESLKNSKFLETLENIWQKAKTFAKSVPDFLRNLISGTSENTANATSNFQNFIQNVVDFVKSAITNVKNFIRNFINAVKDFSQNVSENFKMPGIDSIFDVINGLIAGGVGVAILRFLRNVSGAFKSFGEAIKGWKDITDGVVGILDSVRGCFEAYQTQLKANTLLKIASAIAILAAALVVLTFLDSKKLAAALGAITTLFADLMGSMAIFGKINDNLDGINKTCIAMIEMSIAILILSGALAKIAALDWQGVAKGLIGVAGLSAIMVGSAKILTKNKQAVIEGASQMIVFAVAIKILASACEDLSELSWEGLAKGLIGVGTLMTAVSLFFNKTEFGKESLSNATSIVILAVALKLLASACEVFAQMDWEGVLKGLIAVGALLGEIALFARFTKEAKLAKSSSIALVAIGIAMQFMASVIQDMSQLSWEEIAKGLTVVAVSLASIALAANFMYDDMIIIGVGLIAVSVALVIMSKALETFGGMSWEAIAKGLIMLGGSMAILAVGLYAMIGTLPGSAALLVAVAALAALVPVLLILGAMSWESIEKGLVAIAGVFVVIGGMSLILTPLVPVILLLSAAFALLGVTALSMGVGLMAAGIGVSSLAVGLTALAAAGVAGAKAIASSLTIIITGIIGLIPAILEKIGEGIVAFCKVIADSASAIGESVKTVLLTLIDVIVECVPAIAEGVLKLIVGVLEAIVEYTPQIVDSIFQFLIKILEGIARNLPDLIKAAINIFVSFYQGIIDALSGIDVGNLVKGIIGIGLLSAIMIALAAVAALTPAAMVGVLGMGVVIAELAIVLAAIGALSQIPGLTWLINEGAELMQGIGNAIGSLIGGIVGGFMGGVSSSFPQIGSDLSSFMTNVQPFLDGASNIDPSIVDGVKALSAVILLLTAATLLDSLTSWVTGGSSIKKFGKELSEFGTYFKSYYDSVQGVNGSVVEASANAALSLAEFAKEIPNSGGLVGLFSGENSLSKFAEELAEFGPKLKEYSDSVRGINSIVVVNSAYATKTLAEMTTNLPDSAGSKALSIFGEELAEFGPNLKEYSDSIRGLDANVVTNSATAGKALAEMAAALPKTGGVFSIFTGNKDMGEFVKQLVPFGEGMKSYSDSVSGMDVLAVLNSTIAGKALAELADALPNSGSIMSWFTGNNDMDTFGRQIVVFGRAMKSYSNSVSDIDVYAVLNSTTAGKALAELADILPNSGSVMSWFTGNNDMDTFGRQLVVFGKAMKSYSNSVSDIDVYAVLNSATAGKALAELAENLPSTEGALGFFTGNNDMDTFGRQLVSFGEAMKSYSNSVSDIDVFAVLNSTIAGQALAELAESLPSTEGIKGWFTGNNDMDTFGDQLVVFGKAMKSYSDSVSDIDVYAVLNSATAGKALAELAESLPSTEGVKGWFTGNNDMDTFGRQLVVFGRAMKLYSDSVSDIDVYAVVNSTIAGQALAELAESLPSTEGVSGWFSGNNDMDTFGRQLVVFGKAMKSYSDSVSDIDVYSVLNSTIAGQALAGLAENLPSTEGIQGWFTGNNDMDTLGKQLVVFGKAMKSYSDSVSDIDVYAVLNSTIAGQALSKLAENLPSTEGIQGWFTGNNDMDTFGDQLVVFGKAMKSYSDSVSDIDVYAVLNSATAGKALAELAESLPSTEGVKGWFTGNNDMDTFGRQLVSFGKAMKSYSDSVSDIDVYAVVNSTIAGQALAKLADNLPSTEGVKGWFSGNNDMDTFGRQLVSFGGAMKSYSDSVSGMEVDAVLNSVKASQALVELSETLPEKGGWFSGDTSLADFGKSLSSFGSHFSSYYSYVSGVNTDQLSGVTKETNKLVSMARGMSSLDTKGMSNFGSSLKTLGQIGVTGFITAFTNANSKVKSTAANMLTTFVNGANSKKTTLTNAFSVLVKAALEAISAKMYQFKSAGLDLMSMLINGIKSKDSQVSSAIAQIVSSALSNVKTSSMYSSFYSTGGYLVDGFAAGISASTYKATAKSTAMAQAALEAARRALNIHSPSKESYKLGAYTGMGFVNALDDYGSKSYDAGYEMADSAKTGLGKAISKIRDVIAGDLDTTPTIRPVLDLSNIQNGTNQLYRMMNGVDGYAISGSVRIANQTANSMSRISSNEYNDQTSAAINGLSKVVEELAANPSKTFDNVFNISGNNPKEIAEEVSRIIQKQVERRDALWA